jgi:putative endonuclease
VARRLEEHERGIRGAKYLRGRAPLQLVFELAAGDRAAAQRLEHRVKRLSRTAKEALVAGDLTPLRSVEA